MNIGDRVMVVTMDDRSNAYAIGLRYGDVGRIVDRSELMFDGGVTFDWVVDFASCECHCWNHNIRRIDPFEASTWDECAWSPSRELTT